jgi:hypothetical protein
VGIESLERRVVLSTFHAASVAALEADIAAVSNTSAPNTILLAPGNYVLPKELLVQNADNLTIAADPGKGSVSLIGSAVDRVLEVSGGSVTLSGLNITGGGGVDQGGGILSRYASLTLRSTKVYDNVASQAGGGVYGIGGTLNVENSSIANNRAGNSTQVLGGGIAAVNTPTSISGSSIGGNSVYAVNDQSGTSILAAGGAVFAQNGALSISNSTLNGNTINAVSTAGQAYSYGGAVASVGSVVTVSKGTLQYNSVSTFTVNAGAIAGGAFSTTGGSLTVSDSTVSKNMPGGWRSFSHIAAPVTLRSVTFDGKKIAGTHTF